MTTPSASSRKALSKIASNRLQKELVEWQVNPPHGFKHKVTDNLQKWVIEVNGAPGTLYAGEMYQLQVDFPEHYPMEAPQVIFVPPAPQHPHIYSNGHICLGLSSILSRFLLPFLPLDFYIHIFSFSYLFCLIVFFIVVESEQFISSLKCKLTVF
ncbi:hypothetical protein ABFS83_14G295100 [Erythranthe nasuta]